MTNPFAPNPLAMARAGRADRVVSALRSAGIKADSHVDPETERIFVIIDDGDAEGDLWLEVINHEGTPFEIPEADTEALRKLVEVLPSTEVDLRECDKAEDAE